ncbi:MAG: ParB/RepB/Spo0J family partition protein [Oscillospiraceae bacterium]|nr:ParB/RepB/Spo0J family partition protein [Oscillospiraceae bacterium]
MKETRAEYLPIEKLRPFDGHPFKVTDNEEMDQLTWSILTQGLLTPLVVRPLSNGEYEVVSGHRRLHACKKAGIETVPALIREMDRDEATIALVDSNLHREKILPSEKAYAYKLKMDALSRQGQRTDLTSTQAVSKFRTNELVGEVNGDSRETVRRYIRLTNLISGILQKVDEGKIALTPAVELSCLTETEQADLLETMESEDCTPSLSQAQQLKQLSQAGQLNMDRIFNIMREPKANQQEKISFKVADLRPYFPRHYNTSQMMQEIVIALKERQQRLARMRDHSR